MTSLSFNFSDREQQQISRLLPYWGLSHHEQENKIVGGMKNRTVSVTGLNDSHLHELSVLLQHTGVQIKASERGADLYGAVEIRQNTSAPLTLDTGAMSYYLKPLRKQTENVQLWIHKRLWLPVYDPKLTLTFHAREENHLSEWLSYLIIQHFMHASFTSLADLTFSEYHHAATTLLEEVNPEFAARQLSLKQPEQDEWPELPPEHRQTGKSEHHPNAQPLNPFKKQNRPTEENPINPFRKQPEKERTTIDPFRKHRHH